MKARVIFLFIILYSNVVSAAISENCPEEHKVNHVFENGNGSQWSFCWDWDKKHGIELYNIAFKAAISDKPIHILSKASLNQLELLDPDTPSTITSISELYRDESVFSNQDSCDGELLSNIVCMQERSQGYALRDYDIYRLSHHLDLYSQMLVDQKYQFLVRFRLSDDGAITPSISYMGDRSGETVSDLIMHFYWFLDFDIAGTPGNDIAQIINSSVLKGQRKRSIHSSYKGITTERGYLFSRDKMRNWRIVDKKVRNEKKGKQISYNILPLNYAQPFRDKSRPWTLNDIYLTNYSECEKYIFSNQSECTHIDNVTNMIQTSTKLKDIVTWVHLTGYHDTLGLSADSEIIPRWYGLSIYPRDFVKENPNLTIQKQQSQ